MTSIYGRTSRPHRGPVLLSLSILMVSSCASPFKKFLEDMPQAEYLNEELMTMPPTTVAVLPLENETTDLDAPDLVRGLMNDELAKFGYSTLNTPTITATLREEGITYGGQLKTISIRELGEVLPVQALMYGTIHDFKHFITGFYNQRSVATRFELVDITTGEVLWVDSEDVKTEKKSRELGDFWVNLASQLAQRVVEKTMRKPLLPESKQLVAEHLSTLPWGPGRKGYPSWRWNNPGLKVGLSISGGYPGIVGTQLTLWRRNVGARADLSVGARSLSILHATSTKGPRRRYTGIRVGFESDLDRRDWPDIPVVSIIGGVEALRWRYASLAPNASRALTFGFTFGGHTGLFMEMSWGFYFK